MSQRDPQQKFLRDAAIEFGLTQNQLADQMAVPWKTLQKWLAPFHSKSYREMPEIGYRVIELLRQIKTISDVRS